MSMLIYKYEYIYGYNTIYTSEYTYIYYNQYSNILNYLFKLDFHIINIMSNKEKRKLKLKSKPNIHIKLDINKLNYIDLKPNQQTTKIGKVRKQHRLTIHLILICSEQWMRRRS